MKTLLAAAALAASCLATHAAALEKDDAFGNSGNALTVAVFGDWPYNNLLLANSSLLVNSVNRDDRVKFAIHVGDIHSGSQPCTSASILPPIASSDPGWNQAVFQRFQQFRMPLVYTPGDNEWTDCQKVKEKSSGDPLKELASVRGLFFSRPGMTLGLGEMEVLTQAKSFDPAHPADAAYVENVMWEDSHVVFVTLNVPGSNNDTLNWAAPFTNAAAQAQEVAERSAANARWLDAAFALAADTRAKALVIVQQADMWDPAAVAAGGDGLDAYTPHVRHLADLAIRFGKPVLLLNGDSHVFGSDQPLANPASAAGVIHGTAPVPNLTRITVQGSTTAPAEWTRLTIDTSGKAAAFSWANVAYCRDPNTSCQ